MPQTIVLKGVAFAASGVSGYTVGLRVLVEATFSISDVNLGLIDDQQGGPITLTLTPSSVVYRTSSGTTLSTVTPTPVSVGFNSLQRVRIDGARTVRAAIPGGPHYAGTAWCTAFLLVGTVLIPESEGVAPPVAPDVGGLYARYYNNQDHIGLPSAELKQVPKVNSFTKPVGVSAQWSTRWTGFIKVPTAMSPRFLLESDDGCRMFFNGLTVVDDWSDRAGWRNTGYINLAADTFYPIWLEHRNAIEGGTFIFHWQASPTDPVVEVPGSVLYASLPDAQPTAVIPVQGAHYIENINRY